MESRKMEVARTAGEAWPSPYANHAILLVGYGKHKKKIYFINNDTVTTSQPQSQPQRAVGVVPYASIMVQHLLQVQPIQHTGTTPTARCGCGCGCG
ncbi:hypothetical protein OROGR_012526 [Orobanche gracilis]